MDNKLKEYRDKSFMLKMRIALETNPEIKKRLCDEEKEFIKEYRRYVFELRNNEGGKKK